MPASEETYNALADTLREARIDNLAAKLEAQALRAEIERLEQNLTFERKRGADLSAALEREMRDCAIFSKRFRLAANQRDEFAAENVRLHAVAEAVRQFCAPLRGTQFEHIAAPLIAALDALETKEETDANRE